MSRSALSNQQRVRSQPCHYCGKAATTADHVVPRAKGGTDAQWNLVSACEGCNQSKADRFSGCGCKFCITAVRLWRYPDLPRPESTRDMHKREWRQSFPLPGDELAKLQDWLDRNLPGQLV